MGPALKIHVPPRTDGRASNRLAPHVPPLGLSNPGDAVPQPTMRTMTQGEIDPFVSTQGFGVLALADGNHAYGVPLFYGAREGAIYFHPDARGREDPLPLRYDRGVPHDLERAMGEWASVQLIGRLELVDALSSSSVAGAIAGVPPPLLWAEEDERADEPRSPGVTTFRLVPTKRVGRYSQPAKLEGKERHAGF